MAQQVEYELSLKDLFSGKIKNADQAVQALEGTVHSAAGQLKILAAEMGAAIGIGIGIFKLVELTEEGKEAFEKLEFANSQLEAGLESTGYAAGVTFEMLNDMSNKQAHAFKFTKGEIADMQAQLLTFPKVTKDVFEQTSQAVLDMATRTHRGANEIAIMVGKAMHDPERGITALRRVGVNFNDEQTKMIKKLVEGGHAMEAQKMILKELNTEFAGSAGMAAAADVGFRFHKSLEELQLTLGELAVKLAKVLMPVMEGFVHFLKDAIQWMREFWQWIIRNKTLLEDIAIVIGVTSTAWALYTVVSQAAVIWSTIKAAAFGIEMGVITALGTAVEFLNAMFLASPIGWIVIGIAAVTTAVIYCYKHFAMFRAVLFGVWETVKEFGRIVADVFMGLWHIIHGIFTFNASEIKLGGAQEVDAIFNAGKRLGGAFKKGFDEGMEDFAKDQAKEKEENAPKTIAKPKAIQGPAGENGKTPQMKATGSKNVSIVVNINQLVGKYEVQTKNIIEGASKAKEIVVQALLSAVNDSQIIAGQ